MKTYYFLFIAVLLCSSCSDNGVDPDHGPLTLHFDNIVSTQDLELNSENPIYTNAINQSYSITKLTYYVSSITLKKSDGTIYEDEVKPDGSAGYYLIDEADPESAEVTIENI